MSFFGKKASKADAVIEALPHAIQNAADKWKVFCELPFTQETLLVDRVAAFLVPFEEGLRKNVKAFKDAPAGIALIVVLKGIERSGTHSKNEIEEAFGLRLPD